MMILPQVVAIVNVPDAVCESHVVVKSDEQEPSPSANTSVTSFDSDEATADSVVVVLQKKARATVRFGEETVTLQSNLILTHDEMEALWYTQVEIVHFYKDCQRLAGTLAQAAKHDATFWTNRLARHYHEALCVQNDADLQAVLGSITAYSSAVTHGLAIWACPTVDADLQHRVTAQRAQIAALQQQAAMDPALRAQLIRRASCTWSRPARLLARHLAQAAAAAC